MLKFTHKKSNWKIHYSTENNFKIGHISYSGTLNVSQELYDLINRPHFNWQKGNTNGGVKEIKHCHFSSPASCFGALDMLQFENPDVLLEQ